jgi:hypothetical protein
MHKFTITFNNEDLEKASDELRISVDEVRDLLNHLQTESETQRGKTIREWVLKKLTGFGAFMI